MTSNFRPTRFGRRAALAVVFGGLFGAGLLVAAKAETEPSKKPLAVEKSKSDSETKFVEIASLGDGSGAAAGVGGLLWNSGFTYVAIKTDKAGTTRFIVSAAYGGATQAAPNLRVVAKDTQGKIHEAAGGSTVSGTGAKFSVVTFDSKFDLPSESIAELIVQQATP